MCSSVATIFNHSSEGNFFAPVDAGQFHVQFLVFRVITKQLMVAAILEYVELRQ